MGKGSSWDLQKVKADAVEIGKKLLDETPQGAQGPASRITNAEARWLVTWVEVLINERPQQSPVTVADTQSKKNPHIIVGEPRRCICGVYNGEPLGCKDVLASLDELVKHANIKGSGVSLYAHDILRIESVIRPLVQDCE